MKTVSTNKEDPWVTRSSLLRGVRSGRNDSWLRFEATYRAFLIRILEKHRFQRDLFDDITQEVLTSIWKSFSANKGFKANSRFRTWLYRVTLNTARNVTRDRQRQCRALSMEVCSLEPQSKDGLLTWIEEEWCAVIGEQALSDTAKHFTGKAFPSFEMHMNGKTREEISRELEISKSVVSTYISRVKNSVIKKIKTMESEFEQTTVI